MTKPSQPEEPAYRAFRLARDKRSKQGKTPRLPLPQDLEAREVRRLIEGLERGALRPLHSAGWGLPAGAVVVVPTEVARTYRQMRWDLIGVPLRTKGLWQKALDAVETTEGLPEKEVRGKHRLSDLHRQHGAPLMMEDIGRFRLALEKMIRAEDGLKLTPERVVAVRGRVNRAQTEGERALWQSLLDERQEGDEGDEQAPVAARCQYCGTIFTPFQRTNARTDVCGKAKCRRAADAKRKRLEYHAKKRRPISPDGVPTPTPLGGSVEDEPQARTGEERGRRGTPVRPRTQPARS